MKKKTSQLQTLMTQCGLKNMYQTAGSICAYMIYLGQQAHLTSNPNSLIKEYSHPTPQPDQAEMPTGNELIELDIPEDIPYLLDVPDDVVMSDFDSWAQDVLNYPW